MAMYSADLPTVFALLQNALSQEEAVRKPAESALTACESKAGFCSCLLEIIAARDIKDQQGARWLASVYLKNSVNRYWRQRGISETERPHLRTKLLELIREENNQVATQLALLISKIARFDYPRAWPDLFPSLLQKLQSPDALLTQRVYMVLNKVLKELSTKRLVADQHNFAEITSQLYDYTWHHWCNDTQLILQDFSALLSKSEGSCMSLEVWQTWPLICERWVFCSRVLRRMLIFGFQSDAKSLQKIAPVKQVCPSFLQAIQSFLQYKMASQQSNPLQAFAEKACLILMKTLVVVQKIHPYSFSDKAILPVLLEFCCTTIIEQKLETFTLEHFLIECIVFIQNIVQCVAYRPNKIGRVIGQLTPTMEEEKVNLARIAQEFISTILDNKHLLLLCKILAQRYMVLTGQDLDEWAHDPEAFHHAQDMVQWREKLRPCAESLYVALFENHREVLAPVVVQILKQTSEKCPPADADAEVQLTEDLLLKEAAYNAVGVANYDLYDYINFKNWYEATLSLEIRNQHPNSRILRRRVAWLLGQWVSKIKDEMRLPVYEALLGLLGDSDLAVKLAACRSLHNLIDDVHFYEEEFVPFLPMCFQLLFQCMQEAQEFDSKLQIFNMVSLIIDRLGEKVASCTEKLLSFIPQVWQDSEGQGLLRVQVIVALQRLVIALGPRSSLCYELLFPILQYSVGVNQPDELIMLEDGLQLWQSTLKYAPAMVPQLLELFPHLVSAMERSLDHLQVAMKIIESCILLGGQEFLRHHAGGVVRIMDAVVGNVNEKGMMCTLPVIETLVQCFPGEAPPLLEQVLQKLIILVISGRDEADMVKAFSGAILARVLVQNSSFFAQLTSQPSLLHALRESGVAVDQSTILLFFDSWLDKVDVLTTASKRKVCALSLCILLTSTEPQILDRLGQIISVCTSILQETEEERNGQQFNSEYWVSTNNVGNERSTGPVQSEDSRKLQISNLDPVNQVALAPLLREKLQTCAALHGETAFNAALSRLHPSLLGQLQELMQR